MAKTYLEVVVALRNKLGVDVPRFYIGAPALELFAVEHPVGIKVITPTLPVEPVSRVQREGTAPAAIPFPV